MSNGAWLVGIAVVLLWGLWGFAGKVATGKLGMQVLLWSLTAQVPIVMIYLALTGQLGALQLSRSAVWWGLLVGACAALSSILFYAVLQRNPASWVVPLTALYPAVTVLLSVIFLKEEPTPTQLVGLGLALLAGILLTRG
jgi:transporter family protein